MSILGGSLRPGLGQRVVDWALQRYARRFAGLFLVLWVVGLALGVVGWLLRRPRRLLVLTVFVGLAWTWHRVGWQPLATALVSVVTILGAWAWTHRPSFVAAVWLPARARTRRALVYRRSWQPATSTAGLAISSGRREHLPELLRVRSTPEVDRVRVRMLPGQTVVQWAEACDRLAQSFGVLDVRARAVPGREHEVELLALTRDPLRHVVPVPEPDDPVNLRALPVGVREDGSPLTLPVLGSHLLVAGSTGAGKGSVVWSVLAALGPAIRDGLVEVWAIDPKGGMELAAGAPLFRRFVYGGPTANGAPWQAAIADLLDEAAAGMQARASALRGRSRAHEPTPAEPLILLLVDEVASLTAYVNDSGLRRRIENALSLILSQGRAPAVSVLLATQDPRKEVLAMRDLVPLRVGLRTAEPVADLILGAGARARGAHTHTIDPSLPGIGYVLDEGQAEPVRVRFGYLDDAAIADLATRYAPAPVIAHELPRRPVVVR